MEIYYELPNGHRVSGQETKISIYFECHKTRNSVVVFDMDFDNLEN